MSKSSKSLLPKAFTAQKTLLTLGLTVLLTGLAFPPLSITMAATPSEKSPEQNGARNPDKNQARWSHSLSSQVFQQARREHKLVILDLEAVWCHWCHVMHQQTYPDPRVQDILDKHYIAVRVDHDNRPDLALRYQDYGWPATIVFDANGRELVKRAGYIEPEAFATLLQKIVREPIPEAEPDEETGSTSNPAINPTGSDAPGSPVPNAYLPEDLKTQLMESYLETYDETYGAWGHGGHKFLDADSVEYSMLLASVGPNAKKAQAMAQKTLAEQLHLLDPVWGGMYQYSHGGTWQNPHFEKIMSVQADNLRIYSLAYALWHDPAYLQAAQSVAGYLNTFLKSPDETFYVSQDADLIPGEHSHAYFALNDAQRRQQGLPKVDTHVYARENGWAIEALVTLYSVTGQTVYLNQASRAAQWILDNRALKAMPTGLLGFSHDALQETDRPYLGDSLAMGQAFLALYQATGQRTWLQHAEETARFIQATFKAPDRASANTSGYLSAQAELPVLPIATRDENTRLARWTNLLYRITARPEYQEMSQVAMRFVAQPSVARQYFTASTLLADWELTHEPLHVTVVGHKDDPLSAQLYMAALQYPASYKRLDWWDKREGQLPNPDVDYPELSKSAAFVCTQNRCSVPLFSPETLGQSIRRLSSGGKQPTTTAD